MKTPRASHLATAIVALAIGFVVGLVVAGGGDSGPPTATVPLGTAEKPQYVGEVGVLPPPTKVYRGSHLVNTRGLINVPGTYPLSDVVSFNVPIRNDGSRALVIKKLVPG